MIQLRPYQQRAIDAFYQYYSHDDAGHGLLVLPTAAGKSIIIGKLITEICQRWSGQRILLLSHVHELISQNHAKICLCWPNAPAGIYSASLGKRQAHFPIVSATIQSVYKKAQVLGHRDLVFIDEVHLVNSESSGMYRDLLAALFLINPAMRVCGLTATDYRLDSGLLTEGDNALFDDVIIEISITELLEQGYLTAPIGKGSLVQADLQGVKMTGGDFNIKQMAARFDQQKFIAAALDSDLEYLHERKCIALFCATVENAEHVCTAMLERGFSCAVVHGDMATADREQLLTEFRTGKLHAICSVGVLTTGVDIPQIDCIVLFRATQSPGLYQQIIGRGFRVVYSDGHDLETQQGRIDAIRQGIKPNFLVLDHGGNIERHGAITHVQKPERREKGARRVERAKARICEICRTGWPLEVTICGLCGHTMVAERDATANLEVEASHADIMGTPFTRGEIAQWFDVDDVQYNYHKKGENESLRVTYHCGIMQFNEYIRLDINKRWWGQRTVLPYPPDVNTALAESAELKQPLRIMVRKKEQYYQILQYGFQPVQQDIMQFSGEIRV